MTHREEFIKISDQVKIIYKKKRNFHFSFFLISAVVLVSTVWIFIQATQKELFDLNDDKIATIQMLIIFSAYVSILIVGCVFDNRLSRKIKKLTKKREEILLER